jgi:hypothetical protein
MNRTSLVGIAAFAVVAAALAAAVHRGDAARREQDRRLAGLERSLDGIRQEQARLEARLASRASAPVAAAPAPPAPVPPPVVPDDVFRPLRADLRSSLLAALQGAATPEQRRGLTVIVDYASGQAGQIKAAQEFVDLLDAAGIGAKLGTSRSYDPGDAEPFWSTSHPRTAPAAQRILAAVAPFLNAPARWQSDSLVKIGEVRFAFEAAPRFLTDGSLHYPPPIRVDVKRLPRDST